MWADSRKKSAYVRLDGGEIVKAIETWCSVRENKVYNHSNKAQEDREWTREGCCVGIGTKRIWQELYDLNKKNKK